MGESITIVQPEQMASAALTIKAEGYRLIQICATKTQEGYELTYNFGREYEMKCLRMQIAPDTEILSISEIYPSAFLYENEIQDLFGIRVRLMTHDYKGSLYRIEEKTPFH